jgi:hypothetical protein
MPVAATIVLASPGDVVMASLRSIVILRALALSRVRRIIRPTSSSSSPRSLELAQRAHQLAARGQNDAPLTVKLTRGEEASQRKKGGPLSLLSENSNDVWVRTSDDGLIRASSIDSLSHSIPAPNTGYIVKAFANGNSVNLINNTAYVGSSQERQEQAKNMQNSLLLAIKHGTGKKPTYVVSYDDLAQRWTTTDLANVPGIYQPTV